MFFLIFPQKKGHCKIRTFFISQKALTNKAYHDNDTQHLVGGFLVHSVVLVKSLQLSLFKNSV